MGLEKYHGFDLKKDGFFRKREEEQRRRRMPIGTKKRHADKWVAKEAIFLFGVSLFFGHRRGREKGEANSSPLAGSPELTF